MTHAEPGGTTLTGAPWSRAARVRAVFLVVFLVGQFALCVHQLGQPRPARFGWQMYSGARNPVAYRVKGRNGSLKDVRVGDYLAVIRDEMDQLAVLPRAICSRETAASSVSYRRIGSSRWTEYAC